MGKRKVFDSKLKAKVALEAVKEEKSVAEISTEYNVSTANIRNWKEQFLTNASTVFEKSKEAKTHKAEIEELESNLEKAHNESHSLGNILYF